MWNDKHCFEMYGYDVLLEDSLKPWLIEVNSQPSLHATTQADRTLKMNLMRDVFEIVVPNDWGECGNKVFGAATSKESKVGNFSLVIDES